MFGPDGGLVANAPHIPVHLGAMQETVQYQVTDCQESKQFWSASQQDADDDGFPLNSAQFPSLVMLATAMYK